MNIEKLNNEIENRGIVEAAKLIVLAAYSNETNKYYDELVSISDDLLKKLFPWKEFKKSSGNKKIKYIGNKLFECTTSVFYKPTILNTFNMVDWYLGNIFLDETSPIIKRLKKIAKLRKLKRQNDKDA